MHKHDANARNAIATIIGSRRLPFTVDELLEAAYALGSDGDPWAGYLQLNEATRTAFDDAKNPRAVILKRLSDLGLPGGAISPSSRPRAAA